MKETFYGHINEGESNLIPLRFCSFICTMRIIRIRILSRVVLKIQYDNRCEKTNKPVYKEGIYSSNFCDFSTEPFQEQWEVVWCREVKSRNSEARLPEFKLCLCCLLVYDFGQIYLISLCLIFSLDSYGLLSQACTEIVMPFCTNGIDDMFEPHPWDLKTFSDECFKQWGVKPRPSWITSMYGGKNISSHTNIIFRWVIAVPKKNFVVRDICRLAEKIEPGKMLDNKII